MTINDHIVDWANSQSQIKEAAQAARSLRYILKSNDYDYTPEALLKAILETVKLPKTNARLTAGSMEQLKAVATGLTAAGKESFVNRLIKEYTGEPEADIEQEIHQELNKLQKESLIQAKAKNGADFAFLVKNILPHFTKEERRQFCANLAKNPRVLQDFIDESDHEALKVVVRELFKAGVLYEAFGYLNISPIQALRTLPNVEVQRTIVEAIKEAVKLQPRYQALKSLTRPTYTLTLPQQKSRQGVNPEPMAIIDGFLKAAIVEKIEEQFSFANGVKEKFMELELPALLEKSQKKKGSLPLEGKEGLTRRKLTEEERIRLEKGYESVKEMWRSLKTTLSIQDAATCQKFEKLLKKPQSAENFTKIHAILNELVERSQLNPTYMLRILADEKLPLFLRENEHLKNALEALKSAQLAKSAQTNFVAPLLKAREGVEAFIKVCNEKKIATATITNYLIRNHSIDLSKPVPI